MGLRESRSSQRVEPSRQSAVWLIALVGLVLAAGFLLSLKRPPANRDAGVKSDLPTPENAFAGAPVIVGTLDDDDPELKICLIRDVSDEETIANLIRANDQAGMLKLVRTRRAIFVENRTPAIFLEQGPNLCRVRIKTGDQRGKEVWVSPEFILREGPQKSR